MARRRKQTKGTPAAAWFSRQSFHRPYEDDAPAKTCPVCGVVNGVIDDLCAYCEAKRIATIAADGHKTDAVGVEVPEQLRRPDPFDGWATAPLLPPVENYSDEWDDEDTLPGVARGGI